MLESMGNRILLIILLMIIEHHSSHNHYVGYPIDSGIGLSMHLCTYVGEEGGDGEGAGEGGDTKEGTSSLELMSLDTHRREVTGVHGEHEMLHTETQLSNPTQYVG